MIISVHIPKTAGTSFLKSLELKFGKNLLKDYSNMRMIQEYLNGKIDVKKLIVPTRFDHGSVKCVHGHFLPMKYISLSKNSQVKFVTWLRDPVERLLSHYYYWKRSYDPKTAGPLFSRVIEERWSLERFCFSEELKNLYGKYLIGFPTKRFNYIGITEYYEEDFAYFSKNFLGQKLNTHKENVGEIEGSRYPIDRVLRKELEAFHCKDFELYQLALDSRSKRVIF